jgi:hypothetical protein
MQMLSDDDVNLRDMSADELDAAWDLWFETAQTTNDADPPYTHGVFAGAGESLAAPEHRETARGATRTSST